MHTSLYVCVQHADIGVWQEFKDMISRVEIELCIYLSTSKFLDICSMYIRITNLGAKQGDINYIHVLILIFK